MIFEFLIGALACLRLSILLGEDKGPYRFLSKIRAMLKREAKEHPAVRKSAIHEGVECVKCESVWWGAPIAVFGYYRGEMDNAWKVAGDLFLLWLALSMVAILLNRALPAK